MTLMASTDFKDLLGLQIKRIIRIILIILISFLKQRIKERANTEVGPYNYKTNKTGLVTL